MKQYLEENCESYNGYYITKQKDIKPLAIKMWQECNEKCPILRQKVPLDTLHVDHKHKRKSDEPNIDNRLGFIRSHLFAGCNTFIGKIENAYSRFGLNDKIDLPTLLRNCADFLEEDPMTSKNINALHYTEVPKRKKVSLSEYNKVKKYYLEMFPRKRTIIKKPIYVNQEWLELVEKTDNYIQELKIKQQEIKWVKKTFSEYKKENSSLKKFKVQEIVDMFLELYEKDSNTAKEEFLKQIINLK